MIHSAQSLFGRTLHSSDARFGSCSDLYFDDHAMRIVYLVADTHKWLPGRKTLLSPQIVESIGDGEMRLAISRDQIEDSPPLEEHLPVSRQAEEDLFSHYGWTPYWGLPALTDPSAASGALSSTPAFQQEQAARERAEPNLRSVQKLIGYKVQAFGDRVGKVHDLLVDTTDWTIRFVAVDTHPWIPGGIHLLDASYVNWLDSRNSLVDLRCLAQEVKSGPSLHDLDLPCSPDRFASSTRTLADV